MFRAGDLDEKIALFKGNFFLDSVAARASPLTFSHQEFPLVSLKTLCACVLLVAASACAPKAPVGGVIDDNAPARSGRNRDLITQDDLAADASLRAQSVYEVIKVLRPQFLNDRGTQTIRDASIGGPGDAEAGQVHASVDGGRIVPTSDLQQIHANEVLEIRYLSVAQAMNKFGTAARQGPVIVVTTVKR